MGILEERGPLVATGAAVVVGALTFVFGISTFFAVNPFCWLVALFMMFIGVVTVVFEASPFLNKMISHPFMNTIADYNSGRPLYYRSIVYAGFAFIMLLCKWILCDGGLIYVSVIFYVVVAVFAVVLHFMARPQQQPMDLPTTSPAAMTPQGDGPKF